MICPLQILLSYLPIASYVPPINPPFFPQSESTPCSSLVCVFQFHIFYFLFPFLNCSLQFFIWLIFTFLELNQTPHHLGNFHPVPSQWVGSFSDLPRHTVLAGQRANHTVSMLIDVSVSSTRF